MPCHGCVEYSQDTPEDGAQPSWNWWVRSVIGKGMRPMPSIIAFYPRASVFPFFSLSQFGLWL